MQTSQNTDVIAEPATNGTLSKNPVSPRVWLVMGYRAGEVSQILALGEALGWPYEMKQIRHRRWEFITNLGCGTGLNGIIRKESSFLGPPWPDVVISAGLRNEPVCRWIREQSAGMTRIVHIGRPWASLDRFELVVTTPQYRVPEHRNVLQNTMPLHQVTQSRLKSSALHWSSRFDHLPRPWTAVIMGGNSGPYTLEHKAGLRLGREANALVAHSGGSLLVTSSSRTPPSALDALESCLEVPAHVYRWKPDCDENPYFGYLALADSFIVTGDSAAMLAETCATCKPVYAFDLGEGVDAMESMSQQNRGSLGSVPLHRQGMDFRLGGYLYWQLMRMGPLRLSRDLGLFHRGLIESGRAVWLGENFSKDTNLHPPDDLSKAVRRVEALFD